MDWTGGTRRRFAPGKNNVVLQKQKAHFAKARAFSQHLQGSHHSLKSSYLPDRRRSIKSSVSRKDRSGHRGYGRLEHEVAPVTFPPQRSSRQPWSGRREHRENGRSCDATPGHQISQRHSPGVIYVSSNSQSSSAGSLLSDRGTERKQMPHQTLALNTSMADEEMRLSAKRRQLLARTDWLGLDVLKPIRINFASSHDKDHIGKRRKVRSSASRKGKSAKRKLSVAPFARPFSQRDHTMSGALQPDDIQVKIGTDALISQTQQSKHSHTPGRTSMRHPSTEFGSLSEESMLLGPDEDIFESAVLPKTFLTTAGRSVHDTHSLAAVAGSQITQNVHYAPERPEMISFRDEQERYVQQRPLPRAPSFEPIMESNEFVPEHEDAKGMDPVPRTNMGAEETVWPIQERQNSDQGTSEANQSQVDLSGTDPQPEQPIEEESPWRRMFGIAHASSSHHSIAALRSSNAHVTASDTSSHRPVLNQFVEPTSRCETNINQPKYDSPAPMLANGPALAGPERFESGSDNIQSPSASLKLITKLANHPAAPARQAEEDANDEALWRQFIVGSRDSSDEASQQPDYSALPDGEETIAPAGTSSAFSVSGLGTSVQSTLGDTLFVTGETSSTTQDGLSKRQSDSTFRKGRRSSAMPTSSEAREVADLDEDRIEDDLPPIDRPHKASNIRNATTSILNPKRFKPPKKVQTPGRGPSRFRLSRRTRPSGRAWHSVYDLVDSDGMSIE